MVNKCFAPTCSSGNMSCECKCSVFRAPKDEKHLILWRKAIPRADRILTQSDFVCEKHFKECDIIKEWISDDGSLKRDLVASARAKRSAIAGRGHGPKQKNAQDRLRDELLDQEQEDAHSFDNIKENVEIGPDADNNHSVKRNPSKTGALAEIKNHISKILEKIHFLETAVTETETNIQTTTCANNSTTNVTSKEKSEENNDNVPHGFRLAPYRNTAVPKKNPYPAPVEVTDHPVVGKAYGGNRWDTWTAWSCCSVTCGLGRQIRWRHCILKDCSEAETEMDEKACQLPSCAPGKFLGLSLRN